MHRTQHEVRYYDDKDEEHILTRFAGRVPRSGEVLWYEGGCWQVEEVCWWVGGITSKACVYVKDFKRE